jgi:hypothetical protein
VEYFAELASRSNCYKSMYLGKPLGEQLLGRPRRSCKVNFRMGRTQIGCEDRR